MPKFEHGDAPLSDPAHDLLDMAPHAKTLAEFLEGVPLPFTIGIYGGWGEGKTTYANLLIRYLEEKPSWQPMQIIKFSTWTYITADAKCAAVASRDRRGCGHGHPPHRPGRHL